MQNRIKQCKYGPNCRRKVNCWYYHPPEFDLNNELCTKQQTQSKLSNTQSKLCWASQKNDVKQSQANKKQSSQKVSSGVTNKICSLKNRQCKFGNQCKKFDCKFTHPKNLLLDSERQEKEATQAMGQHGSSRFSLECNAKWMDKTKEPALVTHFVYDQQSTQKELSSNTSLNKLSDQNQTRSNESINKVASKTIDNQINAIDKPLREDESWVKYSQEATFGGFHRNSRQFNQQKLNPLKDQNQNQYCHGFMQIPHQNYRPHPMGMMFNSLGPIQQDPRLHQDHHPSFYGVSHCYPNTGLYPPQSHWALRVGQQFSRQNQRPVGFYGPPILRSFHHPNQQSNNNTLRQENQQPLAEKDKLDKYQGQWRGRGGCRSRRFGRGGRRGRHCRKWQHREQAQLSSSSSQSQGENQKYKHSEHSTNNIENGNRMRCNREKNNIKCHWPVQNLNEMISSFSLSENPELINLYNHLASFLEENQVNWGQRIRILERLQEKPIDAQHLEKLIILLMRLNQEGYRNYFGFFKLTKVIINRDFDYETVVKKLKQQISPIDKKRSKMQQFTKQFPNPLPIQFLQLQDLMKKVDRKNTIFFIDGNNILTTNNKLRKYFQTHDQAQKAQAQIRLNWLVGETLRGFLFFDDYFDIQIRQWLKNDFMQLDQQRSLSLQHSDIEVLYAKKDVDPSATADHRILQKLLELHRQYLDVDENKRPTIILVSADRKLAQQCLLIDPKIKKTAGKQFFKYCKKVLKDKYYNIPEKNTIIRKILHYRFEN